MIGVKETQNIFLPNFAELEKRVARDGQLWLHPLRKQAFERFVELGFPTTKLEEWKYTSVAPIARLQFQPARYVDNLTAERLSDFPVADIAFDQECSRLVFVNGHFSRKLSSLDLPQGVKAISLAEAVCTENEIVKAHLARYAKRENAAQAFVALNTAFIEDGAFIEIPDNLILDRPVFLLFVSTAGEQPMASHPRNLIVVGNNSQASIIEGYVGIEDKIYFVNAVTEIVAGENAVVEHYKLQHESLSAFHVATVQAHQARSSNFVSHSISFGGALVRNDTNSTLDGEGAQCTLNGLYLTAGNQHVDNHTMIDHARPHGTSRELYKGILDGNSTAIFNGSIVVRKDAQKTDARQTNKNLLLSEEATVNSKPQLEINADDVKCSHGTTIGHLEEDSIFYLRSRGIGEEQSRNLLIFAFANDVLGQMKVESVRARLEPRLLAQLSEAR